MLPKFLPELLQSIQSKLPNNWKKRVISSENGASINLDFVPEVPLIRLPDLVQLRVNNTLIVLSVVVFALYFALFAIGNYFTTQVNQRLHDQQVLVSQVQSYDAVAAKALEIQNKTDFYKKLVQARPKLKDKTAVVFGNLGNIKKVYYSTITQKSFTLSIEVNKAIDFAMLINKYLESGLVSKVSILSAEFDPNEGTFKVELEGIY